VTDRGLPAADSSLACPFVAYEDDRDARSDHPDHRHRCYAEVRPAPRATAHQEMYCLTAAFGSCPTFQDWARRESARVRWPSPPRSSGAGATPPPPPSRPQSPPSAAPSPAPTTTAGTGDRPAAEAAGLAASRFLRPEDLGEEGITSSHDQRTWAAPPPWTGGSAPPPDEAEAPGFLADRDERPAEPSLDVDESALLPAVPEWPEPGPTAPGPDRPRRRRERIDAGAPSWEEPRRLEAYPTVRSRIGMPSVSRPVAAFIILALAAAALFLLPSFVLDLGGGGGGAAVSPSPSTTARPSPSATPQPSPTPLVYVVKKGDTMTKIANAHGVTLEALLAANKETVPDPDKVKVGQELIIPVSQTEVESAEPASEEPSPSP
jgi:LysM repeat protein